MPTDMTSRPVLIAVAGLPGVGKTTFARALAAKIAAMHVRIDSIEIAIREAAVAIGSLEDVGYRVGYAIAEDNLRLGRIVIADSVNPWPVTRDAWRDAARRAAAGLVEIEIVCSDSGEHRRRVEQRLGKPPAESGPPWSKVVSRDYRPWDREHVVIDTASTTTEQSVALALRALAAFDFDS
jgi:predicted kinase